MSIDFLTPSLLWLLLAVPLLWFFPRRMDRVARGLLRSALFALVILALARPVLVSPQGAVFQVFVLDQSGSVGAAPAARARELLAQWQRGLTVAGQSAVIVVGADRAGEAPLSAGTSPVLRLTGASPLGDALALAAQQIPTGSAGVVTLVSDGLATDRRWAPAVQDLIARGIPVATYDLGRDAQDVYPARLSVDSLLRVGQTARVDVEVVGKAGAVRVRLTDASGRELAVSEGFPSTDRVTVPLNFEPTETGFLEVRAEVIAAADTNPANNQVSATLAVQPPLRLLYLGERVTGGAARLGELLGRGFTVQEGGSLVLDATAELGGYDLVWLDDRPASRLPAAFQAKLAATAEHDGLGVIVSGGKASFGAGGYDQSTVAGMLPVDLLQRTEKQDPSTALVVVVDTSGSMSGTPIELAKQITRLAIRRLKAHDRIGMIEFYGNKNWALPMQSAANKIAIDRAIGRLQASGGTVLYPGVEEAYYGLKNVNTRYKHILIVTDAGIEEANFEGLTRLIARDKINVSTVLVGDQAHAQSLIDIAAWGHGRFYSASDRYALPEIVLKQATTMDLPAYKNGTFATGARGGTTWWGAVNPAALPALNGYVETQPRPGAEVLLEVEGSAHPVLATWQYGVGRVTALLTEPVGEGTTAWTQWPDYGRWLGRIVSRTAGDVAPFRYTAERRDQVVTVTARRQGGPAELRPHANRLEAPGRAGAALEFRQLTPDYFTAEVVADPAREIRVQADVGTLLAVAAGSDVAAETQVDPARGLPLADLARVTGGVSVDASRDTPLLPSPAPAAGAASLSLLELRPWAALLALLVYLAEIAWRRWPEKNRSTP